MDQPELIDLLCSLYEQQPLSVDKLPYTKEFEGIYSKLLSENGSATTRLWLWTLLMQLRKDGTLPRKSKRKVSNKKIPKRLQPDIVDQGGFGLGNQKLTPKGGK